MSDLDMAALLPAEQTELQSLRGEMADTMGRAFTGPWRDQYWKNPAKQERFRQLTDKASGSQREVEAATADTMEHDRAMAADLGVPVGAVWDAEARVKSLVDANGGNEAALDAVFNRLSPAAQKAARQALTSPKRFEEIMSRAGPEVYEELAQARSALPSAVQSRLASIFR